MVTPARLRTLELGALFALLAAIYAFALTSAFRDAAPPPVAIGIALDLTLTAAAATWWLGVRGAGLPRQAPLVVFGAGVLTARLVLPAPAAHVAIGAGLALELLVLGTVVVRAPRFVRRLRRDADLPLILRLGGALEDVGIPRPFARILTTEVATTGLALTGWFRRAPRAGFTVHRTYCAIATNVMLAGFVALETFVAHLLLARVSPVAAWIATACSIYALLWLIGDAHALRLGRIRVERDTVVIEIARRWAAVIPRSAIVAVHRETAVAPGAADRTAGHTTDHTIDLSIETPTVALELSAPATARGPFGLLRTGTRVALTVDDPAGFIAALAR